MTCLLKNAVENTKYHCKLIRSISLSQRICNNNDDFDFSKLFKDVKPAEMGKREEYKEKIAFEDPFKRTGKIIKNDMKYLSYKIKQFIGFEAELSHDVKSQFFPTHTDVLIIGGGIIGSSIAYWLKQRAPHGMHVLVAENQENDSNLVMGRLLQQFSLPENVQMSQFGAQFLQDVDKNLSIDGKMIADVKYLPHGCLFLADEKNAEMLHKNFLLQKKLGVRNILLSANQVKERFPWLNLTDIKLACLGLENEGWIEPLPLLNAFKAKSINLGAEFIEAEIVGFDFYVDPTAIAATKDGKYQRVERAIVKLPNGDIQAIKFAYCIIAGGQQSGNIAKMAKIGDGDGLLSVPLPIEPRQRQMFEISCPDGPGLDTPLVIDSSGTFFRKKSLLGRYHAGASPDGKTDVMETLKRRVPIFENAKLESVWSCVDEYNTMDENCIIGYHPLKHNILFANGVSTQHAPAVGRAIMELLLDGEFKTIDLSRFGFDRLCLGEPINEEMCVL